MRRQIIVVFLTLLLGAALPALARDRGALFKVSGAGHVMYLFGTMHVGRADFYPLEPRITAALAQASTLALEIDPLMPAAAAARALREHGMASAGATLPAPLAARLARALRGAGLDPVALAPFKPSMVAMALGVSDYARLGYRTDLAVDTHLATLARAAGVKVVELESIDAQMALFGSLSDADQLRYLGDVLALIEAGHQGAEARQVVTAWSTADRVALDALAVQLEEDRTFAGRFMRDVLLDGRNGALADKLLLLLEREANTVAAIGVLHLVGKHSVPALMRARGVTVERVY